MMRLMARRSNFAVSRWCTAAMVFTGAILLEQQGVSLHAMLKQGPEFLLVYPAADNLVLLSQGRARGKRFARELRGK